MSGVTNKIVQNLNTHTSNINNYKNNESIKITSSKILTKDIVVSLGWDLKSEITLNDWKTMAPDIEKIDGAFNENIILTSIIIPASIVSIGEFSFNSTALLKTLMFETGSQLTTIAKNSFSFSSINSITVPSSVTSIESYAFHGTHLLKDFLFEKNSNLATISNYAFENSELSSIVIPSSVTFIGSNSFAGTSSLNSFTFEPNSKIEEITGYAFSNSALPSITIPASIKTIDGAFANTNKLKSITFEPNSNLNKIGGATFSSSSISSIVIPKSVTVIEYAAFYNTRSLLSISFEENSKLKEVGDHAFYYSSISSIIIPDSTKIIGDYAFNACQKLESIEISNNVNVIGKNSFFGTNSLVHIKMPITLKSSPHHFGFTSIQWNAIQWVPVTTNILGGSHIVSDVEMIPANNYSDEEIKIYVFNNLLNLAPLSITNSNIFISGLTRNNLSGKINFSVTVNKFFAGSEIEQTDGFAPVDITLTGFKKVLPNVFSSETYVVPNSSEINSQDYSNLQIIDFLKTKIKNELPTNFILNLDEETRVDNGIYGTINFSITMTNYYDSFGNLNNVPCDPIEITLSGFKILSNTEILGGKHSIGSSEILASDYSEGKIKEYIFNELVIGIKPKNLTINNVVLSENIVNNLDGKINVIVLLNKYIDEYGKEQTIGFPPIQITFFGFKKVNTNILEPETYHIPDSSIVSVGDYGNDEIIEFLNSKIVHEVPLNFEINLIEGSRIDNENDGIIFAQATMINYYGLDGSVKNTVSDPMDVTLIGFKEIDNSSSNINYILLGTISGLSVILLVVNIILWIKIRNDKKRNDINYYTE